LRTPRDSPPVFQRKPEMLHEEVVVYLSMSDHADYDASCFQDSGGRAGHELGVSVRVEDLRFAFPQGIILCSPLMATRALKLPSNCLLVPCNRSVLVIPCRFLHQQGGLFDLNMQSGFLGLLIDRAKKDPSKRVRPTSQRANPSQALPVTASPDSSAAFKKRT